MLPFPSFPKTQHQIPIQPGRTEEEDPARGCETAKSNLFIHDILTTSENNLEITLKQKRQILEIDAIVSFLHKECPLLPSTLEHGIVNESGYVEGSIYRFSCLDGYSIVGQDILYCTKMGSWNASFPTCLRGNSNAISASCKEESTYNIAFSYGAKLKKVDFFIV